MMGSIIGDVVGSRYENLNTNDLDFKWLSRFSTFTDDTILTVATADCILNDGNFLDYYRKYFWMYPYKGFGPKFILWNVLRKNTPNNSCGNGSAMRVSPISYAFSTLEEILDVAEKSAIVSHSHPEAIKGAKAISSSIFLLKENYSKEDIRKYIENTFNYDLQKSITDIHQNYKPSITCQGTVPQAIIAFLDSNSFEDAIRKAVYIGGDSDTIACMTGGLAEAYYGIPGNIKNEIIKKLPNKFVSIINEFNEKYKV